MQNCISLLQIENKVRKNRVLIENRVLIKNRVLIVNVSIINLN
jgi:hypothetical protein